MPDASDRLTLHYQPQVSADGTRIVAVEALLRSTDPAFDTEDLPDLIERYADAAGADALDLWVFQRACEDARAWPQLTVSVNVEAERFRDPDFPERLAAIAAEAGADPGMIELEIVENAYIGDFDAALATITELRTLGFRVALDDFGTGYSSLGYLLRLPVDKLKIDKCFVDDVATVKSAAIVHAVVALSRALGLKVTAEGVETEEQWRFLRSAGCHYMQGWYFSRAVSPARIGAMLAGRVPFGPEARRSVPPRAAAGTTR